LSIVQFDSYSKKTFLEIGMLNEMSIVTKALNLEMPSKIQTISFQQVFNGTTCIIADQTGSGKTLSYLLPLVQRLMLLRKDKTISAAPSNEPFFVIVTPTAELAEYVIYLYYKILLLMICSCNNNDKNVTMLL
jgi:ATP-dependent RNA helicase DDX18/HAS1